MTQQELLNGRIFQGLYAGRMNALYHQKMSWRYGIIDRLIRAVVGLLSIASFSGSLLTFPNAPIPVTQLEATILALASMTVAILLNVLPVGDYSNLYNELYRLWNAHNGRWENLENRFLASNNSDANEYLREINELTTEKKHIESSEPAPWQTVLNKCEKEVNSMYYSSNELNK